MEFTKREYQQFYHGISMSLLSKKSAQKWRYDDETAEEISFLEGLESKVLDKIRQADTPQTDMPKCRNGRYYKSCEYEDDCNPTVCFKALDEFQDAVTDCDHKCIQTEVGCKRTDCPWK